MFYSVRCLQPLDSQVSDLTLRPQVRSSDRGSYPAGERRRDQRQESDGRQCPHHGRARRSRSPGQTPAGERRLCGRLRPPVVSGRERQRPRRQWQDVPRDHGSAGRRSARARGRGSAAAGVGRRRQLLSEEHRLERADAGGRRRDAERHTAAGGARS